MALTPEGVHMWDHALTMLSTIVVIIVGSVIATFVLRRVERARNLFSIRPSERQWSSSLRGTSWIGGALYIIGIIIIIFGCLLIIPTMSRVTQVGDAILLLGAPMVMNGMTLFLYGVIICALGKIVDLLSRSSNAPARLSAFGESRADIESRDDSEPKVMVTCPNCAQQLRIPRGNKGTIKCPKCTTRFDIDT
jgi:hypothetical protein